MSEFSAFILGPFTSYLKSNILLSIGLIVALFVYFGYFCNVHEIEVSSYLKKIHGMLFLVFYLGTFFYVFYLVFLFFQIPNFLLYLRSNFWSIIVKIVTLFYVFFIMRCVDRRSRKCELGFTYEDVDPLYKHILKSDERSQELYHHFINLMPFLLSAPLFVFAYLILFSNTSLVTGLFIYAHIFLAFTFIAIAKGIDPDSFRYAEIFLKDSKKTETGRIRSIGSDSLDLLKKKKDGTTFLVRIPKSNISKMELRTLKEVQDSSY